MLADVLLQLVGIHGLFAHAPRVAFRAPAATGLPGHVDVRPELGSTLRCEAFASRRRRHRAACRRAPHEGLLQDEIRAPSGVGDDRPSQIGSAVPAEKGTVVDFGAELLGRISSVARPAECDRMIRARREEQRSESNKQQHDARIVALDARACQVRLRYRSVRAVDSGG